MSVLNLYSIRDDVAMAFIRPFVAQSDGSAARSFLDGCADKTQPIGLHPTDYTLYRIGAFDDEKGALQPENPTIITKGFDRSEGTQGPKRA